MYSTGWAKYSGNEDRGRQRLYTHEGREHRWKQSGIRVDTRQVTQEEGHMTWNERRVTFQNKTWNSKDRKTQTRHPSLWCDRSINMWGRGSQDREMFPGGRGPTEKSLGEKTGRGGTGGEGRKDFKNRKQKKRAMFIKNKQVVFSNSTWTLIIQLKDSLRLRLTHWRRY